MSCSPFDLRDYFLKELTEKEQREVESHVRGCRSCSEELDRLRLTEAALLSMREEEIPQRIAFVSDKIFEPSPLRRWVAAFWASAPKLGFASAAMLSAAILYSAMARPVPVLQVAATPAPAPAVQPVSGADIQARIDAAVEKAVAVTEARHEQRYQEAVAEIKDAHRRLTLAAELYEYEQKRQTVQKLASVYRDQSQGQGELK